MAAASVEPCGKKAFPKICVCGTQGLLINGGVGAYKETKKLADACRCFTFSKNGEFVAWYSPPNVVLASVENFAVKWEVQLPKVLALSFSPTTKFLCVYQTFMGAKPGEPPIPNVFLYDVQTGKVEHSYAQRRQVDWELNWFSDESACAKLVTNNIHFYENNDFSRYNIKLHLENIAGVNLAPGTKPYHFACYVPSGKGRPSSCRLYSFASVINNPEPTPIALKSFFKNDKVDYVWNDQGRDLLLMTSNEVDKTGASYYGDQSLQYLSVKGETSMVQLKKDGPIYSAKWSPKGDQFCVVYGYMPASATVFNLKCNPVFDMGRGPRNSVYYNPFGNVLLLAGFGNLQGEIEVWDPKAKAQVTTMKAADSTYLQWSADGAHFLTATTAPRLRVNNGYRVWHYSGSLQHEVILESPIEVWDVQWQPCSKGSFPEPVVSAKKVAGIQSAQAEASKQAYRPPGARDSNFVFKKLQDEDEDAKPTVVAAKGKNRKKGGKGSENKGGEAADKEAPAPPPVAEDPEKKSRALVKQLTQIHALKMRRDAGETLSEKDLKKINTEDELNKQFEALQVF